MANQLAVAYSGTFKGAAIFAAAPYDCALDNEYEAVYGCAESIYPAYLSTDEADASAWAADGLIDPISHLAAQRDWVYHGTDDTVAAGGLDQADVAFFQHFGASVQYDSSTAAGHGWISPLAPGECSVSQPPYMDDCGTDPEGEATAVINPLGCWDWWGYLGAGDAGYAKHGGVQITAIMNMVHALGG